MVADRDRSVATINNYVEDKNTNQVISESLKAKNNQQKQETARLIEEPEQIKSSVADLQVEAETMSSEKSIDFYKAQKLHEKKTVIIADLNSTSIKK